MLSRPGVTRLIGLFLLVVLCAACSGSGSPSPSTVESAPPVPQGSRLSSTATIAMVSPTPGQTVTGGVVHVTIKLTGGQIVDTTTTNVKPDEGHIHLYVDNNLVSMNYSLTQDLPLKPGNYVMRAEFVAADHAPFDPRVVTPDVVFTVK
jgi:hypothetical protein